MITKWIWPLVYIYLGMIVTLFFGLMPDQNIPNPSRSPLSRDEAKISQNLLTVVISSGKWGEKIVRTLSCICELPNVRAVVFFDEGKPFVRHNFTCVSELHVKTAEFGLPILKNLIIDARKESNTPYYMFINDDILIHPHVIDHVKTLQIGAKEHKWRNFLATGRRRNVPIEYFRDGGKLDWDYVIPKSAGFVPCAQDYFIISRTFPVERWPDMIIGAACWDNTMVDFMIKNSWTLIDTSTLVALHQSDVSTYSSQKRKRAEDYNCKFRDTEFIPNHECTTWKTIVSDGNLKIKQLESRPEFNCKMDSCGGSQSGQGNDFVSQKLYAMSYAHPKAIGVTYVNEAYASMAQSFLCNFEALGGAWSQIIIIATDKGAFDLLKDNPQKVSVAYIEIGAGEFSGALTYATYEYWWWLVRRVEHFQWILGLKIPILHFEVDAVWIHDVFQEEFISWTDYDVVAARDVTTRTTGVSSLCYCMSFYWPTRAAFLVHEKSIRDLAQLVDKKFNGTSRDTVLNIEGEQVFLARNLEAKFANSRFSYLSTVKYTSGQWYDDAVCGDGAMLRYSYADRVRVLNNNWMKGRDNKIERLKRWRQWFIQEEDESKCISDLTHQSILDTVRVVPKNPLPSPLVPVTPPIYCDTTLYSSAVAYALADEPVNPFSATYKIVDQFSGCCIDDKKKGCFTRYSPDCECTESCDGDIQTKNDACDWGNSYCDLKRKNIQYVFDGAALKQDFEHFSGCCIGKPEVGCHLDNDCDIICVTSPICGEHGRGVALSNEFNEWSNRKYKARKLA